MAFDGITVAAIVHELSELCTDGRIYKIAQTEKDEIMLTIKPQAERGGGTCKVCLSADASLPLVYISKDTKPSPAQAPTFCMVLRKHILNGRIRSITQPGLERIIQFNIDHLDEMGDLRTKTLLIELMGKYSNIIFIDDSETIVDSIKHIPASVSSVREVLPGRKYFIPQTQNKENPLEITKESFISLISARPEPIFKALISNYTGLSNVISNEICYRADVDALLPANTLSNGQLIRLFNVLELFVTRIKKGDFKPAIAYENGHPKDYAAFHLSSYEKTPDCFLKEMPNMSLLLSLFYSEKNSITRIRQKSANLRHIVSTALERTIRKYDLQMQQMKDTQKRDKYRLYGELLNVYGYSAEPSAKSITVNNYNTGEDITIPLDPTLTASQNARRYYERYNKLKRTFENLSELTVEVKAQIDHLESVQNSLDIARTEADLIPIRDELIESGYIHKKTNENRRPKDKNISKPLHYISSDGFDIFVGKNNFQNDQITFKLANGSDWWFHAKGMPGSHVVLQTKAKTVPDRAFEEAASLAAYYSKAKEQEKVEIDYLQRKNVKKPGGAKPGFVVYYTNYSMAIRPDISSLKEVND
ncbi:Rqc2 family fibronectin-binding protein [Butyrivibrio sp. NC3005]|uniref:Rqc2 family fibronectin-binding protein n=1 Tax=Butyrivibrio sp. NC3005 TaxID=1280685 RepID=UPI0003FEE4C2|nr:NFACT RNA binding domain-containing protein [Butyrivibrio sp. NC3005]